MPSLADHLVLLSDLRPHLIYETPEQRDDPRQPPAEIASSHAPVTGHDEPGDGITVHRAAPWLCRCGVTLALDYREASAAWAAHAARLTGLPAEVLEAHMLDTIRGDAGRLPAPSVATCRCGAAFAAPDSDPTDADAAVALWAAHVEGLA